MTSKYGVRWVVIALCLTLVVSGRIARADEGSGGFHDGRWRLEISGAAGFDSGKRDRKGDSVFNGNVEYEWPVYARCTLGIRAYPILVYHQNDNDPTVTGGGVGLVARVYQHKDERRGWYLEAGVAILGHENRIEGNGSNINFLPEAGVGYQFKNNWHVTLLVQHISNAHLDDHNQGANSVGLAIGYRF